MFYLESKWLEPLDFPGVVLFFRSCHCASFISEWGLLSSCAGNSNPTFSWCVQVFSRTQGMRDRSVLGQWAVGLCDSAASSCYSNPPPPPLSSKSHHSMCRTRVTLPCLVCLHMLKSHLGRGTSNWDSTSIRLACRQTLELCWWRIHVGWPSPLWVVPPLGLYSCVVWESKVYIDSVPAFPFVSGSFPNGL